MRNIRICCLLFACAFISHAATFTFSTIGLFNNGLPAITFNAGGGNTLTLDFDGLVIPATANTPTFIGLGDIGTFATGAGAAIPAGTSLSIYIFQTVPGIGSGHLDGTITGSVSQTSSTGQISFAGGSTTINGIIYSIANTPLSLVPFSTHHGETSVQAFVNTRETGTPEPATFGMLTIGVGLLVVGVRKRRV